MRSTINLDSIKKSLSGLTESIKGAQKQSEQISENVQKRNREKREGLSMSSKLFARRRDNQRRKEKEDLLEASGVMGSLRAGRRMIQRTTKGFLGRILDFLGTVLIGWTIMNLPKIIKLAEGVMKRLKKYFDVLNKFISNTQLFFTNLGSKFKEVFTLLTAVNFEPFLSQVKTFMKKIQDSFTSITVNTVKTVRKFLDKSDQQIADEIGIGDLYRKMGTSDITETSTGSDQEGEDAESGDIIEGDEYRENLILQGLEILKEKQNGKLTKEQNRMLDRKDFKSLDEILRGNDIILLQNIVNGEFVYMPYNEYEKMSKELNQAGVFPVGQQFEQTSNPYEELEKVDKTPPPASNSDNLTNDNSDKGTIFDKIKEKLGDFELPFNKKKADITVPITIASAKRPSSMNDSNSGTNLGDINNGRLKYNEVFFNSIG
tara:strand:- start:52 stop:1344 length:1293 start_codon:yes stop_codon:yes gene_type:complete